MTLSFIVLKGVQISLIYSDFNTIQFSRTWYEGKIKGRKLGEIGRGFEGVHN